MAKKVRFWYARCRDCGLDLVLSEHTGPVPDHLGCPRCLVMCPVYCSSFYRLQGCKDVVTYREHSWGTTQDVPGKTADHTQKGEGA